MTQSRILPETTEHEGNRRHMSGTESKQNQLFGSDPMPSEGRGQGFESLRVRQLNQQDAAESRGVSENESRIQSRIDRPKKSKPPLSVVQSVVSYDKETGEFVWLDRTPDMFSGRHPERSCRVWNAKFAGKPAFTTINTSGYFYADLMGYRVLAHRAAWLLCFGSWPTIIDHIDRNPLNNRIANLRDTTTFGNGQNRKDQSATKPPGVRQWPSGRWGASLTIGGKRVFRSWHDTMAEAVAARNAAIPYFFDEMGNPRPPEVKLKRRKS